MSRSAAATAVPALPIWCWPMRAGSGRSSSRSALWNTRRPFCSNASKSSPHTESGAITSRALALIASSASGGCIDTTAAAPVLRMPAFSRAISATVAPSLSAWSSEIGRDDAERGARDHIGGVEPPSEADLQDHRVGRGFGERQKGGGRGDLEERDGLAGVDALDGGEPVHQLPLADRARPPAGASDGAGKRDALMEADEMRRGVGMHTQARRLQHGLQERRHRALAVGARHMDHGRQPALGMPELGQQRLDAAQRKVDQERMQPLQLGKQLVARAHGSILAQHPPVGVRPSGSGSDTVALTAGCETVSADHRLRRPLMTKVG